MHDHLAISLARQARTLDLNGSTLEEAEPEVLRVFVRAALQELAALGLIPHEEEIGCWAAPRSAGH